MGFDPKSGDPPMPRSLVPEAVEQYIAKVATHESPVQQKLRAETATLAEAGMQIGADQGAFFALLIRAISARKAIEIGTFTGYSALSVASALPADGRLVTLELKAEHAAVARANLERAGVLERVEILVGPAVETLAGCAGPFDFAFIDADKANYPAYFAHAVRLARPGALIVLDNVVREGRVIDPDSTDPNVPGTRAVHEALAHDPRVTWTTLQTVGVKKHDGFTIALVN